MQKVFVNLSEQTFTAPYTYQKLYSLQTWIIRANHFRFIDLRLQGTYGWLLVQWSLLDRRFTYMTYSLSFN